MAGVINRTDAIGDELIRQGQELGKLGLRIKEMVSDGVITSEELDELSAISSETIEAGQQVVETGVETVDVGGDIAYARQVLNIGRHEAPNRHLADRFRDMERMKKAASRVGAVAA